MIAIRTLAVIAALAAAGLAAAPAQGADRCGHRKARTIRQTARVRVYEGDFGVFACARATGRRVHLYDDDGEYDLGEIDLIRGDFVAYDWVRYPTCKDACPPGVTGSAGTDVTSVRNGHTRELAASAVDALVLARSGGAAWLVGGQLWIWTRTQKRELDSGNIPARSVHRSRGVLHWVRDGQPESARMP